MALICIKNAFLLLLSFFADFFCVDDDFIANTSFLYKMWYMMMATTTVRFKYYHAWLLADAICNNSGLGFNGYEKDGNPKWDLISNINVISFEVCISSGNSFFFKYLFNQTMIVHVFCILQFSWQLICVMQSVAGIWVQISGFEWLSMNAFQRNTAPYWRLDCPQYGTASIPAIT